MDCWEGASLRSRSAPLLVLGLKFPSLRTTSDAHATVRFRDSPSHSRAPCPTRCGALYGNPLRTNKISQGCLEPLLQPESRYVFPQLALWGGLVEIHFYGSGGMPLPCFGRAWHLAQRGSG